MFPSFPLQTCFWLLRFAACLIPPSTDNHREASYSRTQQRGLGGLRVELYYQPCDHGRRKNDASNHSATLLTILYIFKKQQLHFNLYDDHTTSNARTKQIFWAPGFCQHACAQQHERLNIS